MKLHLYLIPMLAPLPSLMAQTEASSDESVVFELSPFIVDAEEDSGYYASQTLAGTRLKTNVEDVASSIQILTADFLDDIGATDGNQLFLYTTSTESAGLGGNFTDYSVPSGGTSYGDEGVRVSPQFAQRIRGLARADITRNYFNTMIPSDRFNTERVEINRGANAILFGLGSPAGISNTVLSQARFSDFGEVRWLFDSEGSQRAEGDFNYQILPDRLALRVGLLKDKEKFYQEPAREDDERIYLNMTAKLWEGATVRGFFENGDRKANRPSMVSPGFTLPFYFQQRGNLLPQMQAVLDAANVKDINGNPLVIPADFNPLAFDPFYDDLKAGNYLTVKDVNKDGVTDANDDLARIKILRQYTVYPTTPETRLVQHPNASRHVMMLYNWWDPVPNAGPVSGVNAVESNNNSNNILPKLPSSLVLPYALDPGGNKRFAYNYNATIQPWREWDVTLVPQGIQNLDIFDFTKYLLSGDSAFQNDEWNHYNATFEQLLLDNRIGIEVAYDRQEYERESFVPYQDYSGIFIDMMETYYGIPNPNYGRPFVQGRGNTKNDMNDERETLRATAFVRLDPKDMFGDNLITRFVGVQTFTAMYSNYQQSGERTVYDQYLDTNVFGATLNDQDGQLNDRNKQFTYLIYLSDQDMSKLDNVDEVRLNRSTTQQLWGHDFPATILTVDPVTGNPTPISTDYRIYMNGYSTSEQEVDSYAAIWNGNFLNNHLIGVVGLRRDEASSANYFANTDLVTGLPDFDDMILSGSLDDKVDTLSWSAVAHAPDRFMPAGMGLSAHYGVSENFTLGSTPQDFYGNKLPATSGETKEYGFTLKLFDEKLIARVNWFETDLLDSPLPTNLYQNYVNRGIMYVYGHLLEAEFIGDLPPYVDPDSGNPIDLTPNYAVAMQALQGMEPMIPQAAKEATNILGADGKGGFVLNRENMSVGDTEDINAKGFEVELVYNPTRSWRMSLNVAKQETVKTNYAPRLGELMAMFDPYIGSQNGLTRNLYYYPNYDDVPPQYMSGKDQTNLANTVAGQLEDIVYNEYRLQKSQEGKSSPEQRAWRVNFVTNYRFRDGWLEGAGIGTAVRWQDGAVIGYPTELVGSILVSDVDNPHISPSETNVDLWIRYQRKLFNKKIDWTIELRVFNVNTDADDLIPVVANNSKEYSVAMWRAGNPRTWRITNSFKF